jgi:hypothetical protein
MLALSFPSKPQRHPGSVSDDTGQRYPVSKQITQPKDAQTIADYSNPAFVLGGWTPVVEP